MSSECYIEVENEYVPVNMTTTAGIRCINSNQFVPPRELEQHFNSQIQPKYIQHRPPRNTMMEKLEFRDFLDVDEGTDIAIKSVLPDELPNLDIRRKDVMTLQTQVQQLNPPDNFGQEINDERPDFFPPIKIEAQQEKLEVEKPLIYRKKVRVNSSQYQTTKKKISTYKNEKRMHTNTDRNGKEGKQQLHSETVCTQGGYIVVKPDHDSQSSRSTQTTFTYDIFEQKTKKKPVSFNTSSTQKSNENTKDRTISPRTKSSRFRCPECRGFYCEYCRSDIPPIYRPVPDENNEYRMHPNTETIQWYQNHYYRSRNVCLRCQQSP